MVPGLLGIAVAIALIIFLTLRKWKLGWAMFLGSLVVAVFGGFTPSRGFLVLAGALTSPTTINLALIITAITALGYLLRATGGLKEIITSLNRLVGDIRILMMLIPSMVGLLMVPGGAVFSAPMMQPLGEKLKMTADTVSAANIIFRHLGYGLFPFYASLLLVAELAQVNVYVLIRYNIPVILFGLVFAYFYFFHSVPGKAAKNPDARITPGNVRGLLVNAFPFILVLVLGIGFNLYFPLSLLAGIVYVVLVGNPASQERGSVGERLLMVWRGIDWSMVLAIMGIMVFKDAVGTSGALDALSLLLLDLGIPLILLAVLFCMLTGLITGNNSASLGISVPLFLPMLPEGGLGQAYVAVMYIGSLMGYLTSPFHLCLVLSTQYLKASLPQVIKEVLVPSIVTIIFSMALLLFY